MTPPDTTVSASGASERGHARLFVIVPLLFVAAYFGARAGLENTASGSARALFFALLPVPFLAAFLWIYARGVRQMAGRRRLSQEVSQPLQLRRADPTVN